MERTTLLIRRREGQASVSHIIIIPLRAGSGDSASAGEVHLHRTDVVEVVPKSWGAQFITRHGTFYDTPIEFTELLEAVWGPPDGSNRDVSGRLFDAAECAAQTDGDEMCRDHGYDPEFGGTKECGRRDGHPGRHVAYDESGVPALAWVGA